MREESYQNENTKNEVIYDYFAGPMIKGMEGVKKKKLPYSYICFTSKRVIF